MANVLIVEDTAFFRKIFSSYLKELNHTVVAIAADGLSAVKAFKKYRPDYVLMDAVLPRASGFDACSAILKFNRSAMIILTSAINYDFFASRAFLVGAKDFLLKPFDKDTLASTMHKISLEIEEMRKRAIMKRKK